MLSSAIVVSRSRGAVLVTGEGLQTDGGGNKIMQFNVALPSSSSFRLPMRPGWDRAGMGMAMAAGLGVWAREIKMKRYNENSPHSPGLPSVKFGAIRRSPQISPRATLSIP